MANLTSYLQQRSVHARVLRAVGHAGKFASLRERGGQAQPHQVAGAEGGPAKDAGHRQRPAPRSEWISAIPLRSRTSSCGTDLLRCRWEIIAATGMQQIDRIGSNGLGASIAPAAVGHLHVASWIQPGDQGPDSQRRALCVPRQAGRPSWCRSTTGRKQQQGLVGWTAAWPYFTWHQVNTLANLPQPVAS